MILASVYGSLGADPAEHMTKSGKPMATVSFAVNVGRGEEEATEWIGLVAFGRQAEALLRCRRGDLLSAMGPLTRRTWTDRDGNERESWNLAAESLVSARTVRPGGGRSRQAPEPQDFTDDEIPI